MKSLAGAAQEYLAMRRALGYKLRHHTWWLPDFVAYLEAHGSAVITVELAVRWARQPPKASASWWAHRLCAVRQFARHHSASDPRTEVPPAELIPFQRRRQTPHIYTTDEVVALLEAARRLKHPMQAASYTAILGLLSCTGMRISEALALDAGDLDWDRALLTVRGTKFGKSRHVPLHRSALTALRNYAHERDRLRPAGSARAFFLSCTGERVILQNIQLVFLRLLRLTGLDRVPGRRPRIHDFRHTFVVNTLRAWYRAGVEVERRLPWLSTYLGHVSPTTTYWYLTATPDLLALAGARAERAWTVRP